MVTREQFLLGIIRYLDEEVISSLPTASKWTIGAIVLLAQERSDAMLNEILGSPFVKPLNVVDANGLINVRLLASAFKSSAEKYGPLSVSIPFGGKCTFSCADIDKIARCIEGGQS